MRVRLYSLQLPLGETISDLFRKGVEWYTQKLRSNHARLPIKISDDAVQINTKNEPCCRC